MRTPQRLHDLLVRYNQAARSKANNEHEMKGLKQEMSRIMGDVSGEVVTTSDGKEWAIKRVHQDRRKPAASKLVELLDSIQAPPDAYTRTANEDYVAEMLADGRLSVEDFAACLTGAVVDYLQIVERKDEEPE